MSKSKSIQRFFAIDLAKRESQLCVTDADGDVLEERRFSTTPAKLEEIAAQLTKHDTVCFEMTTNSFAIARLFKELSPAKVLVSNPMKTKLIASARSQPTLDVIKNLAKVLQVSSDELIFGEDERSPSDDFKLQFEAVSRFPDDEKNIVKALLEGMILKHEAKRWANA
ncbi:MAG TPA: transposase [Pyrinomonadaceae bacterium]|nr:transposase [Pyrinomonadaceae bacterium]